MNRILVAGAAVAGSAMLALGGFGLGVWFAAPAEHESASPPAADGGRTILYYRNPMGLPDISPVPKKDSMGMDYIPVYADDVAAAPGTVRIAPEKVQRAGVRYAAVERRRLTRTIRGAGQVVPDESRLATVTAKFSGHVSRLAVRTTGERVSRGAPLLEAWVASEELLRRQSDYVAALARGDGSAEHVARALREFDLPERAIAELARTRTPRWQVGLDAPATGTVIEKPARDGMRFEAGDVLFTVADLSVVWIDVAVAEQDLPLVRPGQPVQVMLVAEPGASVAGRVDFVYPQLDAATRTARLRVVVPNPDERLKLGQYAQVDIDAAVAEDPVLAVPASAVIDDGRRRVAFARAAAGTFAVRELTLGQRAGDWVEVRDGLAEGEQVVAAGTFLIDAESNLQSALSAFTAPPSESAESAPRAP